MKQIRPPWGFLIVALSILPCIHDSVRAQGADVDQAEPPKIAYGVETDFNARYVFRGLAYSPGPVKQTSVWVTVAGFTAYAWGNFVLHREPQRGEFNELDFGLSYQREWKRLRVEPALDFYRYRSLAPDQSPPTGEASVKLSVPVGPLRVFTKQIFDVGSYRGAYFGEAGVSHERTLNRKTTVAASLSGAWASAKFNAAYAGIPKRAFNLIGAEASLTYAPNHRFYLRPHFEFTRIADRQLRRRLNLLMIGNFGLAIGFNLNAAPSR